MKQRETTGMIVGLALVLGGGLLLLGNFGLFANLADLVWALLFAAGGAAFLAVFLADTNRNWWALFPTCALVGIGALIGLDALFPQFSETLGGGMFLGALSLAFWGVYITHREHWWAIIPGGALLTLAGVAVVGNTFAGETSGALFFLGMAATFGLVYLLPTPHGRMLWAIWPAGACLVLGVITLVAVSSVFNYVWPLGLILGGLYLVYRTMQRRATE